MHIAIAPPFENFATRYTRVMVYIPSGSYPSDEPVEGPTQPDGPPGVPVQDQPPRSPTYDPTYGAPPSPNARPNDPFNVRYQDQESEYGWGPGMYPDPVLDYSAGGSVSRFPIADPDTQAQLRNLVAIKRTDVSNPGSPVDPYALGNTDRFGAGPPLVRQRGRYRPSKYKAPRPPRMRREW